MLIASYYYLGHSVTKNTNIYTDGRPPYSMYMFIHVIFQTAQESKNAHDFNYTQLTCYSYFTKY